MLVVLLTVALADSPEPEPKFKSAMLNAADRFEAKVEKGVVVWGITATTAIGICEVEQTAGAPPKKMVVRLKGLTNLEYFNVANGKLEFGQGLNRKGPNPVRYVDETGRVITDPTKAAGSIAVAEVKGGIEVTITFAKPGKEWKLTWYEVAP
jgi:hypothetical protein